MLQLLIAVVLNHQGGQLTVQFAEDGHITIAHLIQHGDDRSFAVCGIIGRLQGTDIRDITVITNRIVVDVVTNFLYQTVITHGDIPQGGIIDA